MGSNQLEIDAHFLRFSMFWLNVEALSTKEFVQKQLK